MTKKEFIESMKDMPDNSEVFYWNLHAMDWEEAKPYLIRNDNDKLFIGIE